ncbi:MAG: hypothetical protein M3R70_04430 [Actinomycetota bacterium]|nr:hypothetical protein [Actinomycetota bacterium]
MKATVLGAPRPIPGRLVPAAAGGLVVVLALPVFLLAGWRVSGWAIAALVWVGAQALGLLLARVQPSPDNLAASSVLAFGMMGRVLGVLIVLVAVAASDGSLALAAAIVYALAYTVELAVSVASYFVQEPTA